MSDLFWTDEKAGDQDPLNTCAVSPRTGETYSIMYAHVDEQERYIAWLGKEEIGDYETMAIAKAGCEIHELG